jgi:putative FmdB family regulatory protein
MPIHVYECEECLKEVQVLTLPGNEAEIPDQCPHCGWWGALRRKVTSCAIRFIGEWESNDREYGDR